MSRRRYRHPPILPPASASAPVRTTRPVRPACEPVETSNEIVNDALDLIEGHVRTVLEHGGEFALRMRLERLLAKGGRAE